jgi:hypothetical protein
MKGLKFREESTGGDHLSKKKFMIPWLFLNITTFFFYSFVHQSGVTKSLFFLHDEIRSPDFNDRETAIIFTGSYLPPQHLLHLEKYSHVKIHDLSTLDSIAVHEKFYDIMKDDITKNIFYVVIPNSWQDMFITLIKTADKTTGRTEAKKTLVKSFHSHFSAEVIEESFDIISTNITEILSNCRLNIWKIERY